MYYSEKTVNPETYTWIENMEKLGFYFQFCTQLVDDAVCGGPVLATQDSAECFVCGYKSGKDFINTPTESAAPALLAALREPLYPESGRQFADDLEAIARAIVDIGGFTDSPADLRAKAATIRAAIAQAEGVE